MTNDEQCLEFFFLSICLLLVGIETHCLFGRHDTVPVLESERTRIDALDQKQ
jgi:hypothetical protein